MKGILIPLLTITMESVMAQVNLVPNPSFEDMVSCPFTSDQANFAIGWSSFGQSPDYYNQCSLSSSGVSIPYNFAGFQYPFNGQAYMGIQTFFNPGTREFIGANLITPLTIGTKYYVSIKVCSSFGAFVTGLEGSCASNKIGIKFSTVRYSINYSPQINNYAHIFTDSIISDTINWTTINGTFISDSIYNYIIIGNFFDDVNTDTMQYLHGYNRAYYLIDDVCVSSDSLGCSFTENLNEYDIHDLDVSIFPNPVNNILNVKGIDLSLFSIEMYDLFGKGIKDNLIKLVNNSTIDVSKLNYGIYFLKLFNEKKSITRIIIINH
jgi:hypothetical protein